MATPLYKFLKSTGTTFYAFPSAAEDITQSYQNDNLNMSFSRFSLLNLPKKSKWQFDNFEESSSTQPTVGFNDSLIESLRNYVANHEVVTKETLISSNETFYDNTQLRTTSERIFFKWLKKLNVIQFDLANEEEYFQNLDEFASNDENDDDFFTQKLWRERRVNTINLAETTNAYGAGSNNNLHLVLDGTTNLRNGDEIIFNNFSDPQITAIIDDGDIYEIIDNFIDGSGNQVIILDLENITFNVQDTTGTILLDYQRVVEYIGEITSVNNVSDKNKNYTEVVAHIGDHMGKTPDILFKTLDDDNYRPNLQFPLLPSQFQPEIIGAENFNSPIRQNPQDYPGDHFAKFDTTLFTYNTEPGDSLRRSGNYYGVLGDVNNTIIQPDTIDGISLDFDRNHYVKMNIINREVFNFDEFNALDVNNEPPQDFEFNAILWYYTVTDNNGNSQENLYGISFLDNIENDPEEEKIPTFQKLVNDGAKDGTSYSFSLNLNYNIIDDNVQPLFNPNNINSLFSFDLYNEAMRRLASANSNFTELIDQNIDLKEEVTRIKGLLYSQTDLNIINSRIRNLEELLKLYSTLQIQSTDTIGVTVDNSQSPSVIRLNARDSRWEKIRNINTTDLYSIDSGLMPMNINIPEQKDILLNITNDDFTDINIEENLKIVLDRDLDFKQTVKINIDATDESTENKKLDIFIKYNDGTPNSENIETPLITDINLPVYFNTNTQNVNTARSWENLNIKVDQDNVLEFIDEETLRVGIESTLGLFIGDTIRLNNFHLGTQTQSNIYDGQYSITDIDQSSNYVELDITSNEDLTQLADTSSSYPDDISSDLTAQAFIDFNKGLSLEIVRKEDDPFSSIENRYLII